jgi:anti-sigma factor RsiW
MTTPTFRDVELLSAYLDGQLSQADVARLQTRLKSDPQLASVYEQLGQSRALLRKLPARRAPRNFTLTRQMAGVKAPTPRSFPLFRFASALAGLLLVLTFAANALGSLSGSLAASAPLYGKGGGEPSAQELPSEAGGGGGPVVEAPLAPAPTEAPAEAPAATAAPLELAPLQPTGTPQQDHFAPTEQVRNAAEPTLEPTVMAAEAPPALKDTGNAPAQGQAPAVPAPRSPFIPSWLQIGLLGLAIFTGGAAWFVRWKAEADFVRKRK